MKRIASLALALLLVLSLCPAAQASGTVGGGFTNTDLSKESVAGSWSLNLSTGALTVTGSGSLGTGSYTYDGATHSLSPWAQDYAGYVKTVTFSSGVTAIPPHAFQGCVNLRRAALPGKLAVIGEYAFSGCSALVSLALPETVTSIGANAFSGCAGLVAASLPSGLTYLGAYAFSGCGSLVAVTVPAGITALPMALFNKCGSLTSVALPDSLTSVGKLAFNDCANLHGIALPAAVREIGASAFAGCAALKSMVLPTGLTALGAFAFQDCVNLASVKIPTGVTVLDGTFRGCTGLKSVTLHDGITELGQRTFQDCVSLTSVTLPKHLKALEYMVFYHTGLVGLTIPDTVAYLDQSAVAQCADLQLVVMGSGVTSIDGGAFLGDAALRTVYWRGAPAALYADGGGYGAFEGCADMTFYVKSVSGGWTLPGWTGSDAVTYDTALWETSMDNFARRDSYTAGQFPDVNESAWYGAQAQGAVQCAVELGLMSGDTAGTFRPDDGILLCEAVKIAAMLHNTYNGDAHAFDQSAGVKWYSTYVSYALEHDIIQPGDFDDYDAPATRAQTAYILAEALPRSELAAVNTVDALPDLSESARYGAQVYLLFRAGVLTGDAQTGLFRPGDAVTRAETAAVAGRLALVSQRITASS